LDSMSYVELYELPTAEPWTLDIFLDKVMVANFCKNFFLPYCKVRFVRE
jgi:hypothetical protein